MEEKKEVKNVESFFPKPVKIMFVVLLPLGFVLFLGMSVWAFIDTFFILTKKEPFDCYSCCESVIENVERKCSLQKRVLDRKLKEAEKQVAETVENDIPEVPSPKPKEKDDLFRWVKFWQK